MLPSENDMDLQRYAAILRTIDDAPYEHYPFRNKKGRSGYEVVFRVGNRWLWYGVTGATGVVSPSEVADAITDGAAKPETPFKRNGFGQKVFFGGRWFLVHIGSEQPCRSN